MDGVGSGEQNSSMAAEIVQKNLSDRINTLSAIPPEQTARQMLTEAIISSGQSIKALQAQLMDRQVDTTACAGMICESTGGSRSMLVANVGDSRLYLMREGNLTQITNDHTRVQAQVNAGLMTPGQAWKDSDRGTIYKTVGSTDRQEMIDFFTVPVQKGDLFLVTSDGITDNISPEVLPLVINQEAAKASENNGQMNGNKLCEGVMERAGNIMGVGADHSKHDDMSMAVLRVV